MKIALILLLLNGCGLARFSGYDNDGDEHTLAPKHAAPLTEQEIIAALEGRTPDLKSVSPGEPYPVKPLVKPKPVIKKENPLIPNSMQWSCCRDVCRGFPKNVAREPDTKYVRCTCADGRVFRVTRLRGAR
jgi:hypothetical protein